ncbi:leucine-rich repeat domain-containing protein [Thiomicrorhabdus sp. 6S2-11]|uniref:Leucine-rich repeat domain-containing protein n=1 Tax=Thiomicrorhabdus marina TaxID=2818442 RepID=A0ABS3Q5M2_9GAMM|nr:leucine-rich repeat domain-containing protein [Thiomicrorhabdus marina]MBO1927577.1 leucine-rich repeat domain-containing protein [Thiomicrorhabdus marina]
MNKKTLLTLASLFALCLSLLSLPVQAIQYDISPVKFGSSTDAVEVKKDLKLGFGKELFRLTHPSVIAFNASKEEYLSISVESPFPWSVAVANIEIKQKGSSVAGDVQSLRLRGEKDIEGHNSGSFDLIHLPIESQYISNDPYELTITFQVYTDDSKTEEVKTSLDLYILASGDAEDFKPKTFEFDTLFYLDQQDKPKISGLDIITDASTLITELKSLDLEKLKRDADSTAASFGDVISGLDELLTNDLKAVVDTNEQAELAKNQNILTFLAAKNIDEVTEQDLEQVKGLIAKYNSDFNNLKSGLPDIGLSKEQMECKGNSACKAYIKLAGSVNFRPELISELNKEEKTGQLLLYTPSEKPFSFNVKATVGANQAVVTQFKSPRKRLLSKRFFQVYPTPVGVPVVLSQRISMFAEAEFSGKLNANAELEFNFDREELFAIGAGLNAADFTLDGENCTESVTDKIKLYKCRVTKKNAITATASIEGEAEAEATLWLYPEVEFMLYRNASVTGSVEPGVYTAASLAANIESQAIIDDQDQIQEGSLDKSYSFKNFELGAKLRGRFRADFGLIYEKSGEEKTAGICFPLELGICNREERYEFGGNNKFPVVTLPSLSSTAKNGILGKDFTLEARTTSGKQFFGDNNVAGYEWQAIGKAKEVFAVDAFNYEIALPLKNGDIVSQLVKVADKTKLVVGESYTVRLVYWSDLGQLFRQTQDFTIAYNPPSGDVNLQFSATPENKVTVQWDAVAGATEYLIYRDGEFIQAFNATEELSFSFVDETSDSATDYTYQILPASQEGIQYNQPVYEYTNEITKEPLIISDSALKACINRKLGLDPEATPTRKQYLSVTSLVCRDANIQELSGIEDMSALKSLYLDNNQISDLSALQNLSSLVGLDLRNNQISNINSLSDLTNLETLMLQGNQIDDISALANMSFLDALGLHNNHISDLSSLRNLTKLKYLSLYDNEINEVTALTSLAALETLELSDNQISDIGVLSNLTNLDRLYLENNQISNINALANLYSLRTLELSGNQIADLSALTNLSMLRVLSLYNNQVSDISNLSNLTELERLDLDFNEVSNISSLNNLTSLQSLSLWGNQVNDISAVASLTKLQFLDFSFNQIKDISSLVNLTNLTGLTLFNNQINDINSLYQMTTLKYLHLSNNQITDLSGLANLTNLARLSLSVNQISDVSPLSKLSVELELSIDENCIQDFSPIDHINDVRGKNNQNETCNEAGVSSQAGVENESADGGGGNGTPTTQEGDR